MLMQANDSVRVVNPLAGGDESDEKSNASDDHRIDVEIGPDAQQQPPSPGPRGLQRTTGAIKHFASTVGEGVAKDVQRLASRASNSIQGVGEVLHLAGSKTEANKDPLRVSADEVFSRMFKILDRAHILVLHTTEIKSGLEVIHGTWCQFAKLHDGMSSAYDFAKWVPEIIEDYREEEEKVEEQLKSLGLDLNQTGASTGQQPSTASVKNALEAVDLQMRSPDGKRSPLQINEEDLLVPNHKLIQRMVDQEGRVEKRENELREASRLDLVSRARRVGMRDAANTDMLGIGTSKTEWQDGFVRQLARAEITHQIRQDARDSGKKKVFQKAVEAGDSDAKKLQESGGLEKSPLGLVFNTKHRDQIEHECRNTLLEVAKAEGTSTMKEPQDILAVAMNKILPDLCHPDEVLRTLLPFCTALSENQGGKIHFTRHFCHYCDELLQQEPGVVDWERKKNGFRDLQQSQQTVDASDDDQWPDEVHGSRDGESDDDDDTAKTQDKHPDFIRMLALLNDPYLVYVVLPQLLAWQTLFDTLNLRRDGRIAAQEISNGLAVACRPGESISRVPMLVSCRVCMYA